MKYILRCKAKNGNIIFAANGFTSRSATTSSIYNAQKFSGSEGAKILQKMAPRSRKKWELIIFNPTEKKSVKPKSSVHSKPAYNLTPVEKIDYENTYKVISETVEHIPLRVEYLNRKLRDLDIKQNQILLDIQKKKFNAYEGFCIYRELHDLRVERRNVKNEIKKITIAIKSKPEHFFSKLEKIDSEIDNAVYIPRKYNILFK